MERIHGTIHQILHRSDSLTIASLKTPYQEKPITVISRFECNPNAEVSVYGNWSEDHYYGTIFNVTEIKYEKNSGNKGIFNYLVSKNIKGIGPKIAKKIIETFSENTLNIINDDPQRLREVPGLGNKKSDQLIKQLGEQKQLRDTVLFLQEYDVPVYFAKKLFAKFGENTISIIRTNPFILASKNIRGIGFKTADLIALKLGLPKNSAYRIKASLQFIMNESTDLGHCCLPLTHLIERTDKILNNESTDHIVTEEEISQQISILIKTEIFIKHVLNAVPMIWKKELFQNELSIAFDLKRILFSSKNIRNISPETSVPWAEERLGFTLAEKQKEALTLSIRKKIHIITGGPGTGKTTITEAILIIFQQLTHKIILAAPTGKAAKRLSEVTRKRAVTIHSLLRYDRENRSFKINKKNPLDCDLIIVDESGMIDTILLKHFLQALPDSAIVLFIGDIHQLPSVGPGNILKDMIRSDLISVTELNEVFRQVHDSGIITNAHLINQGIFPELYKKNGKQDFLFFRKEDPKEALEQIVSLITDVIPGKFHISIKDIQVLSPMKKGVLGTHTLNESIRKKLNPNQLFIMKNQQKYSAGDKVMQTRNNYGKEVFNGDIGYIQSIDFSNKSVTVLFDAKYINYTFNELNELTIAYAISVHKYQGSESPCIIIPIHTSHYMMLYRNLLYTAITRGKKLVVLIGSIKAIAISVNTNRIDTRFTGLEQAIKATRINHELIPISG
ncbi:MAG: ATP-dependent RecD-like DNA helicase [Victivallaceae bacterium]